MNILQKKESISNGEKFCTVREAAVELGLSVACIRSWVTQRRIGYVRLGRAIRIPAREIRRLIESGYIPVRDGGKGYSSGNGFEHKCR